MNAREELKNFFAQQSRARAISLARRGRWDEAEREIETWQGLDPDSADIHLLRARIWYHQGRRQQALDTLRQAEIAGADRILVERMRLRLISDDTQRTLNIERRLAYRRYRALLWKQRWSAVTRAFANLSERECVALVLALAFIVFIVVFAPHHA